MLCHSSPIKKAASVPFGNDAAWFDWLVLYHAARLAAKTIRFI
jgi:hypothetical protein